MSFFSSCVSCPNVSVHGSAERIIDTVEPMYLKYVFLPRLLFSCYTIERILHLDQPIPQRFPWITPSVWVYIKQNVCFYLHKVGHSAHLQVNNNGTEYKVEGGHYRVNEKFLQFINKISGLWPSLSESYSYVPRSKRSKASNKSIL